MIKKLTVFILCIFQFIPEEGFCQESGASIVINADTREVIFGNNYNTPMAIASTTKIMTAIIAIENSSASDIFTVSVNAQNQEGSSVYLKAGQKISQKELLYSLMLNSGNDAAMTIAENIGGTSDGFASMMNEKAKELGLKNTNFENPHGLPSDNHYSTAYDMAQIMAHAMKSDYFMEIVSQKEYQLKNVESITYLKNHNKLLWQYPYCTGGKTGYTKSAGRCLVTCSQKDGKSIVCVTLNHPDDWQDHITYSDEAFKKIDTIKVMSKYQIITTKKINNIPVNILSKEDVTLSLMNKNRKNLRCKLTLNEKINGDIFVGDEIGVANIYYKNHNIATVKIISGRDIKSSPQNVLWENFNYVLHRLLLSKQQKTELY